MVTKFHINKHGVPAPCRAQKGNCPYGGSESHFNTIEEAQEYANRLHAEEFGVLGGVDNNGHTKKYTESFEFSSQELDDMKGKYANVDYDGKSFSGEIIGTYYAGDGSHNNGMIIQGSDGTVKHIKAHRMHKLEIVGDDTDVDIKILFYLENTKVMKANILNMITMTLSMLIRWLIFPRIIRV